MRVITGTAKGMKLAAPAGNDTRPTSDMAKEAVFSIIQFEVAGAVVLDLFAGSGQMGIEALSRGASRAVLVDSARDAFACIRENLEKTRLADNAKVVQADAESFVSAGGERFDIAFVDPPYGKGLLELTLGKLSHMMNDGGVIICESEKKEELPETAGRFAAKREYRYGKAKITTYRLGAQA